MNPYLIEVQAPHADLMEVNAMKRSKHRITSSIHRTIGKSVAVGSSR
jgi:hypothetical protein